MHNPEGLRQQVQADACGSSKGHSYGQGLQENVLSLSLSLSLLGMASLGIDYKSQRVRIVEALGIEYNFERVQILRYR